VKASAVAPANPVTMSPFSPSRRTFRALPFITVSPIDTCPSPTIARRDPLRTARMVVECQMGPVVWGEVMPRVSVRPSDAAVLGTLCEVWPARNAIY
jgi:hypothetical protein